MQSKHGIDGKENRMSKLDNAIADVAYILDSLMALREIHNSGSCNDCGILDTCKIKPKLGQMVRYNCPFWLSKGEKK